MCSMDRTSGTLYDSSTSGIIVVLLSLCLFPLPLPHLERTSLPILFRPLMTLRLWRPRCVIYAPLALLSLLPLYTLTINENVGGNWQHVFSQYINIRRGQIICAVIGGWVICPWEILAHAVGFLTFMAGYTWSQITGSWGGATWTFRVCIHLMGGIGIGTGLWVFFFFVSRQSEPLQRRRTLNLFELGFGFIYWVELESGIGVALYCSTRYSRLDQCHQSRY